MANQQSQRIFGLGGYIDRALVPRPITLLFLLVIGSGMAEILWKNVDSVKFLAWVGGVTAPFCMLCATAVWAMRDKSDLGFLNDHLTADQFLKASELESSLRRRSTRLAAQTCVAACFAGMPTVSNQLIGPVWHWMVLAAGAAAGFAVYSYLLADFWDHQLRSFRNKKSYESKLALEREILIRELEQSEHTKSESLPGWTENNAVTWKNLKH